MTKRTNISELKQIEKTLERLYNDNMDIVKMRKESGQDYKEFEGKAHAYALSKSMIMSHLFNIKMGCFEG